jgi:hypothetical protein
MKRITSTMVNGEEKNFTILVETTNWVQYPIEYSTMEYVTVKAISIGQAIFRAKCKIGFNLFFTAHSIYE